VGCSRKYILYVLSSRGYTQVCLLLTYSDIGRAFYLYIALGEGDKYLLVKGITAEKVAGVFSSLSPPLGVSGRVG